MHAYMYIQYIHTFTFIPKGFTGGAEAAGGTESVILIKIHISPTYIHHMNDIVAVSNSN